MQLSEPPLYLCYIYSSSFFFLRLCYLLSVSNSFLNSAQNQNLDETCASGLWLQIPKEGALLLASQGGCFGRLALHTARSHNEGKCTLDLGVAELRTAPVNGNHDGNHSYMTFK